jgi:hypothetical protein
MPEATRARMLSEQSNAAAIPRANLQRCRGLLARCLWIAATTVLTTNEQKPRGNNRAAGIALTVLL